jgi:hypothetical protein
MEVMMVAADDSGERVLRALGNDLPWLREHLPVIDTDTLGAAIGKDDGRVLLLLRDVANRRVIEHPIPPLMLLDPAALHRVATFLAERVVCAPFN